MTRTLLALAATVAAITPLRSQSECDGQRYRYTSAYDNVSVSEDHVYGSNTNVFGANSELRFDFYEAVGNAETDRPLLIIAHGGFFLTGSKQGPEIVPLCEDFARMGYAVASISYRLGILNIFQLENELIDAVWRAVHDGRAAVRYFRKSVEEEGNPWGIDTDRIYMGGISAGAFLALHHAYVDEDSEVPTSIDQSQSGMGGGLEGESGNPGYSSQVAGIFNISGALKDASWMQPDDEPLISIHGTNDGTVPYNIGSVSLIGIPVTEVNGSATIHEEAEDIGLDHCFMTIEGAGHVPHLTSGDSYDVTISTIAGALSSWICESYEDQCGEYDYTSSVTEHTDVEVSMYPNPSENGKVTVSQSNAEGPWQARILNMQGRVVNAQTHLGPQATLNLSTLPMGLYVIEVAEWGWRQPLILR